MILINLKIKNLEILRGPNEFDGFDADVTITEAVGVENIRASQQAVDFTGGGAVGKREELNRMLESYLSRKTLIQSPQRQKAMYLIDRFDGGINLNKAPRDLATQEACQMDCMSPSKAGRLVRLGDFTSTEKYIKNIKDII